MLRNSTSGTLPPDGASSTGRSTVAVISSPLRGVVTEGVVRYHREQQHHAHEELEPIGFPAGVYDALLHHAEDECADRGADRGAVSAGQQAAADHRGDNVDELVADTLPGLHRVEREQQMHPGEP